MPRKKTKCDKGFIEILGKCIDDNKIREAGLGKFEGGKYIDKFIWDMSLEGGPDKETGDVTENGTWYGLFEGKILDDVQKKAKEHGDKLTRAEREALRNAIGAIISEDDRGFVDVKYYEGKHELKKAWEEREERVRDF